VAGFTSGIAVIIFLGQIPGFLGLTVARQEYAPELLRAVLGHLQEIEWHTAATGLTGLAIVLGFPKLTRRVPAAIVAVAVTTVLVALLHWPAATIGTTFGSLPSGFPGWHFPEFTLPTIRTLMVPAFTIAALGAIESLLSATVADGMTDTRHDSNSELIGQGLARS
jgi:SulP family sulfate permease